MVIGRDEFKKQLRAHAETKRVFVEQCHNNEMQTRTTLINPYLRLLGHDVENPNKVRSEHRAAVAGENKKADYAILRDHQAWIVIEAKPASTTSNPLLSPQLASYDLAENTDFALYTNGEIFQWYIKPKEHRKGWASENIQPFLRHDALEPSDRELDWLWRFHPEHPEHGELARIAGEIGREEHLLDCFEAWFEKAKVDPPDNFLRLLLDEADLPDTESHRESAKRVWARMIGQNRREVPSGPAERPRIDKQPAAQLRRAQKPGVIATVAEMMARKNGASMREIAEELERRFPERELSGMRNTAQTQVSRYPAEHGLKVEKTKDATRGGTVYRTSD